MAYNRLNKLLHMRHVIEVYQREKKDGNTTQWVYDTHIYPQFHITIKTLYNWLATPVNKLIKEEQAKIAENKLKRS